MMVNGAPLLVERRSTARVPEWAEGKRHLLTTGDIAKAIGVSQTWVQQLTERGEIKPCAYTQLWRHGRWEFQALYMPEECMRLVVERLDAGKARPRRYRQPRQLEMLMEIKGGKR